MDHIPIITGMYAYLVRVAACSAKRYEFRQDQLQFHLRFLFHHPVKQRKVDVREIEKHENSTLEMECKTQTFTQVGVFPFGCQTSTRKQACGTEEEKK